VVILTDDTTIIAREDDRDGARRYLGPVITDEVPVPGPSRWRVGRWMQRHPLIVDAIVAALISALAFGSYIASVHQDRSGTVPPRPVDALGFVFVALASLPLVIRRRQPLTAMGLILVGTAGYAVRGYADSAVVLSLFIMMGTIGARFPRRRSLQALAVAEVVMVPAYFVAATRAHSTPTALTALFNGALLVVPWVFGENVRHRRQTFADAQERAVRAEQERAAEAQRAVAEERTRIARELHDVVAHAMTVMVVQASAARRVLETSPDQRDQAIEALTHVEGTGREGLAEMRRLLGVLRQRPERRAEPELTPQPGAHDLSALVRSWTDAGLDVDLSVQGDLDQLPPGIDLTAYRVVQEALTNTFKHAGPARARVSIVLEPSELQLEVPDDGRGAAATPPPTPGHGLVGMHERVALYGGTVDTGPRAGGGFAVRALVPLTPPGVTAR
jgi:signal transduction histidine kinase